jgi:mono/diheme cytochrome c family protein
MDELLQQVAELRGMPASLVERSAKAKADKTGTTMEAVLREWAGESSTPEAADTSPSVDAASESDEVKPDTPTEESVAVSTDYLVELAAEAKRMPPRLILTSAQARSVHSGSTLDDVLADWAGVDLEELRTRTSEAAPSDASSDAEAPPATPAEAAAPASPEPVAAAAPVAAVAPASTEPAAAAADEKTVGDDIEIIEAELSDTSDVSETDAEPAGTRGKYPIWLAAAFVLIPLLAVVYILVSPNGPDCGSGGQLGVDAVTGEAVNCDGSEYGVVSVDNFSAGGALYQQCVACHSDNGSGGVGPAFTAGAILATFPAGSCSDHVEWVTLGTAGWPEPTYGATDKAVGGVGLMPAFGTSLTEEQIVQVALYERVAFGGQDLEEAEADCGLVTDDASAES